LIVFESADEVLHGLAPLIKAIKGAGADQVHRQEAASFFGGVVKEDHRSGCHLSLFLYKVNRISIWLGFSLYQTARINVRCRTVKRNL
jgi:hypothetical protein